MATVDLEQMRRLVDDTAEPTMFSDGVLSAAFAANAESYNGSAAFLWRQKAASYADQIDVNEAGSSRPMSQLQRQALEMAREFQAQADKERSEAASASRYATTRAIERV
jgi:hypothetical protein